VTVFSGEAPEMKRWLLTAVATIGLVNLHDCPAFGAQLPTSENGARHIRYRSERIEEVANIAYAHSTAFRALIDVLESSDVVVYVEQGRCMRAIRRRSQSGPKSSTR
jgi:hypothetical protein